MNLRKPNEKISKIFEFMARGTLSQPLIDILMTISWTTVKTLLDLRVIFTQATHAALKRVMVNSLTMLALLEVFMTTFSYFSEVRVKVSYIIDTVLVVILTEVMVFWFRETELMRIVMVVVLSLIAAGFWQKDFHLPELRRNYEKRKEFGCGWAKNGNNMGHLPSAGGLCKPYSLYSLNNRCSIA